MERIAAEILDDAERTDAAEDELFGRRRGDELPVEWKGGRDRRQRIRAALGELDRLTSRDYETRMVERAEKEAALGHKLTGPKPKQDAARRAAPQRATTTDPHSRVIPQASKGVVQGYNAQAAATGDQIVVAAEVTATTNDQTQFVPMATAVTENLADAGHADDVGVFLADAGYWSAANATTDVGAEVLIATRKTAWRKADKPDDDKLAVLAKVNLADLKASDAAGQEHHELGIISDVSARRAYQRLNVHRSLGCRRSWRQWSG